MKTLFVTVPQWYPMNPYASSAILTSQLKNNGLEAYSIDLNIDFFNTILTKDFVLQSAENAKQIMIKLSAEFSDTSVNEQKYNSFSTRDKTDLIRYKTISDYLSSNINAVNTVAEQIDSAVNCMKNKAEFFNPESHFMAKDIINDALQIVSLPYSPAKIMIDNYIANPIMSLNYTDVKQQCYSYEDNMFIPYFEKRLTQIIKDDISLIGISVSDLSQLIPALTLGRLIKENSRIPVCFGGNYIYKIINEIKQQPEFFKLFCDYVSVGDGEIAAVELAKYIDGQITIEDVHSLIWINNENKVISNTQAPKLQLDKLYYPDFDDYDFSQYFSPEIVLPIQLGKGCYWGKCAFCDFYTGQQCFDIKSVKRSVDEVEYLASKYNVNHFIFVDEAVPPAFYDKLATDLISRNLKIYFYSFARFDNGFTRETLQNLYNAGARFFSWGYETASQRLLDLMNKGINSDIRQRILNDCREIGLWNQCTFLLGYPTETALELQKTIDVIEDYSLINSCTPSNFVLKKNAILSNEIESVGLHNTRSNGDFHISCSYDSDGISMDEVKKNRMAFQTRFLAATANRLWSLGFTDTDHLLLYLAHYGRDWVRDYRLKYSKKQY